MSPDEIKRIVTETFARYETQFREPAKITEYMHEQGTWRLMGKTPRSGVKNKADYTASLIHTKDVSDTGLRITPTSFLISGDKAAVEAESYMKMKDGREYQNQYAFLIEFRDGKIFSVKEYMDTDYLTGFFSGRF